MPDAPIPAEFERIHQAIVENGFYAWYTPPDKPTRAGFLVCCGRKSEAPGGGYSHGVRMFVRNKTYYFLTNGPCCYEIGPSIEVAIDSCVACMRDERDNGARIPSEIVETYGLRPLHLFEWEPIHDTSKSKTTVDDMLRIAHETSERAQDLEQDALKARVINLMWLMRDYCVAGHATQADVDRWEEALKPAFRLELDRLARRWRQMWEARAEPNSITPKLTEQEVDAKEVELRESFQRQWERLRELAASDPNSTS